MFLGRDWAFSFGCSKLNLRPNWAKPALAPRGTSFHSRPGSHVVPRGTKRHRSTCNSYVNPLQLPASDGPFSTRPLFAPCRRAPSLHPEKPHGLRVLDSSPTDSRKPLLRSILPSRCASGGRRSSLQRNPTNHCTATAIAVQFFSIQTSLAGRAPSGCVIGRLLRERTPTRTN